MLYCLSLLLLVVIGFVDRVTGYEISFSIFYLMPIVISSWYLGMLPGIVFAAASAVVWLVVDISGNTAYSFPLIPYWNMFVRLGFFFIISIMLSRLKKAMDREREQSHIDFLTRALNLRSFMETSARELHRMRRYRRPVTLIYLDCDNFKAVNDRFGHQTGNSLLQNVARTIGENTRATDAFARLGGDEFAILLPETDQEVALGLAGRLSGALEECMNENEWPVTFSLGIATFRSAPEDAEAMLRAADNLMYEAKNRGKNGSVDRVFDEQK
ncbi:MAG: diguanylate cyclase [Spirochaetales bacterium]|nr:diguanylate cyclase [Spirochaetales bacterium]